jgi:hypothetical protein
MAAPQRASPRVGPHSLHRRSFVGTASDMMQTQRDVEPHDSPADGLEAIVDFEPHVVFAAAPLGHLPMRLGGRFALHLVRVGVRERPRGAVPHTPHLIEAPHGVRL